MGNEYLNFQEISQSIAFKDVLNWLNIPYQTSNKELKGKLNNIEFIVSIEKNLFLNPKNEDEKGSIINFVSLYKDIDLRSAASELKAQFLSENKKQNDKNYYRGKQNKQNESEKTLNEKQVQIPELNLEYSDILKASGFTEDFCKEYEFGLCKRKSIMSGKIAFKVKNENGNTMGYVGFSPKDSKWHFPKNFKLSVYNIQRCVEKTSIILVVNPLDCLKIISFGWQQTVAILSPSMTSEQEEELKRFKQILVIHKEPDNIVQRLSQSSFVRKIIPSKEISQMTKEEFAEMII